MSNSAYDIASRIRYVDNHLLVVDKPAGMLVQGDVTGDLSLLEAAREWVRVEYRKPGNVFLGLVHRLDRPVSGLVVFARTSKSAARLSEQFRARTAVKTYWAIVEGRPPSKGHWVNRIERAERLARIVREGGQEARLDYRLLRTVDDLSLVEIELETGRHHQIRLQFSHAGFPILGDVRYKAKQPFGEGRSIALHAQSLQISHPTTKERMRFSAEPPWPSIGPWPIGKGNGVQG